MVRTLLSLAVILMATAVASAESVAVVNSGFEDPAQDPGGWTNTLAGWEGPTNAGDSFIEYIDGFKSEGNNHIGMAAGAEVSQNLGIPAMPNTTYTLTVGVGRRNASFTVPGNISAYGLYVGGDKAAGGALLGEGTYDASPLADLTFVDQTLTVTTGAAVPAGNLYISLRSDGVNRAHFDNVRLSAVPEPSSMALGLLGLMGLARFRRR